MKASTAWVLALGVSVLHGVFAAATWSRLPRRTTGCLGSAVAFAVVCSSHCHCFYFTGSLYNNAAVSAEARNIPYKERFLKLPEKERGPVVELVQAYTGGIATIVGAMFILMHWGMYLTALRKTNGLPWYVMAFMYAVPVVVLMGLVPWSRAVKQAVGRAEAGAGRTI